VSFPAKLPAVFGDAVSGWFNSSRFDRSGIDQQNRNTVLYWIHSTAFHAFQARGILFQGERLLASWANQDIEQILRNHDE
jgi:hypothetical protein